MMYQAPPQYNQSYMQNKNNQINPEHPSGGQSQYEQFSQYQ